ncbi:MAG: hypothetical protein ABIR39_21910 [Nocardioides sp.]|uniref:hypothetical protein n=1 Tax=Nocardioides sp. TaxID=35761 RepID=UPI0032674063
MTYGENGGQLRAALTPLLRQHRIQHRLGGQGMQSVPESTTPEQREELGQLIQRYRHAAMGWCLHAVEATTRGVAQAGTTERPRGPAEDLRYRLKRSINFANSGLPTMEELTTGQEFPMVEGWRQVARAAALGEHDFPGLMDQGRMSSAQSKTVLQDAAYVTQALVVLDTRYKNIPDWIPIRERGWLDRAAHACAAAPGYDEPDYSVDLQGWRPPSATIDGPPMPGIGGVLQAEHNMLVHLSDFPNALNLRHVMDAQRILSHEGARLAANVAPDLVDRWQEREQIYAQLTRETRNVKGLIGSGGVAVAEAANTVTRVRRIHADEITPAAPLRDLAKLFTRTDARIAAIIEQGVEDGAYLVGVKLPRIVDQTTNLIHPVRERYVPITQSVQSDLIVIARADLRPPAVAPRVPADAQRSREALRESLEHRPTRRGGPVR